MKTLSRAALLCALALAAPAVVAQTQSGIYDMTVQPKGVMISGTIEVVSLVHSYPQLDGQGTPGTVTSVFGSIASGGFGSTNTQSRFAVRTVPVNIANAGGPTFNMPVLMGGYLCARLAAPPTSAPDRAQYLALSRTRRWIEDYSEILSGLRSPPSPGPRPGPDPRPNPEIRPQPVTPSSHGATVPPSVLSAGRPFQPIEFLQTLGSLEDPMRTLQSQLRPLVDRMQELEKQTYVQVEIRVGLGATAAPVGGERKNQADGDSLWWPFILTRCVDAGAESTDVIVLAFEKNSAHHVVVLNNNGPGVNIKLEWGPPQAPATMNLGSQYWVEFTLTDVGGQDAVAVGPATQLVAETPNTAYAEHLWEVFAEATGYPFTPEAH